MKLYEAATRSRVRLTAACSAQVSVQCPLCSRQLPPNEVPTPGKWVSFFTLHHSGWLLSQMDKTNIFVCNVFLLLSERKKKKKGKMCGYIAVEMTAKR